MTIENSSPFVPSRLEVLIILRSNGPLPETSHVFDFWLLTLTFWNFTQKKLVFYSIEWTSMVSVDSLSYRLSVPGVLKSCYCRFSVCGPFLTICRTQTCLDTKTSVPTRVFLSPWLGNDFRVLGPFGFCPTTHFRSSVYFSNSLLSFVSVFDLGRTFKRQESPVSWHIDHFESHQDFHYKINPETGKFTRLEFDRFYVQVNLRWLILKHSVTR